MTRVLVIDDNEDFRNLAKHWLEAAGFAVAVALDGRIGLELQRYQPAEVIFTDIFMPDSDGFELIATVRREYPETKIVVMSGGGQKLKRDYLSSAELIGEIMSC